MTQKAVETAVTPSGEVVETQEQRDVPFQKRLSAMLQAEHKARIKWHAGGSRVVASDKPAE